MGLPQHPALSVSNLTVAPLCIESLAAPVLSLTFMEEHVKSINEMVNELTAGQQAEVRDFVEFLLAQQRSGTRRQPQFDWAGALKDMRDDYTSVDLQHESARWRSEAE